MLSDQDAAVFALTDKAAPDPSGSAATSSYTTSASPATPSDLEFMLPKPAALEQVGGVLNGALQSLSELSSDLLCDGSFGSEPCVIDTIPAEILQMIALYLPDASVVQLLLVSWDMHHKLCNDQHFWRMRFLNTFDAPRTETATCCDADVTPSPSCCQLATAGADAAQPAEKRRRTAQYDYKHEYQERMNLLLYRQDNFKPLHMVHGCAMLAEHDRRNYGVLERSALTREFMFRSPMTRIATNEEGLLFHVMKSLLIPALGFPGIAPRPVDPVYRIVYDSPHHPIYDSAGLPEPYVISHLVTFWQMMNLQRQMHKIARGMDRVDTLESLPTTSSGQTYVSLYAFFHYWDFVLFRSAPLSSESRATQIGEAVRWKLDIPDKFDGPFCARVTGETDPLGGEYYTYCRRRAIIIVEPLDEPVMGVRGWAKFRLEQMAIMDENDHVEEQPWIHEAVIVPGSKAIIGRWRDGQADQPETAVEGPLLWVRYD
ncbi:uncharacterized protein V1510DRAFT_378186 [Dipodascopsis tothii]|uniref:uncharacterized protein n=1 Tax=Dipodascopsis tothii TaxID=44089 RepID=UPI0034CE082F